jgi:hypothetical protein
MNTNRVTSRLFRISQSVFWPLSQSSRICRKYDSKLATALASGETEKLTCAVNSLPDLSFVPSRFNISGEIVPLD